MGHFLKACTSAAPARFDCYLMIDLAGQAGVMVSEMAKSGVFTADNETRRALTGLDPEHGCKARATRDDIAQVGARRIKKNG